MVLRQQLLPDQLLLERPDKIQQLHRLAVSDVIDPVRGRRTLRGGSSRRSTGHDPQDPLHDVVYIGEIPHAAAVVIQRDALPPAQAVGELEVCHVRTAGRTVYREEAQTGGRDPVQPGIGTGQQLIGLLGGRVQADRRIGLVLRAVGQLGVAAVYGGGRGVNQVLHPGTAAVKGVAAGLQYPEKADQVALNIGVRVVDGIPHAGLSRQVYHHGRGVVGKGPAHQVLIGYGAADEGNPASLGGIPVCRVPELLQPPMLQPRVIIVVQLIQNHHPYRMDPLQQQLGQPGADKARPAGNQDRFPFQRHVLRFHVSPSRKYPGCILYPVRQTAHRPTGWRQSGMRGT